MLENKVALVHLKTSRQRFIRAMFRVLRLNCCNLNFKGWRADYTNFDGHLAGKGRLGTVESLHRMI